MTPQPSGRKMPGPPYYILCPIHMEIDDVPSHKFTKHLEHCQVQHSSKQILEFLCGGTHIQQDADPPFSIDSPSYLHDHAQANQEILITTIAMAHDEVLGMLVILAVLVEGRSHSTLPLQCLKGVQRPIPKGEMASSN